jgi:hypothetical protein
MVLMLMRRQSVPGILEPQAQAVRFFRGKPRIDSAYSCQIQHSLREQMNRAFIVSKQFDARFAVHSGIYDAIPAESAQNNCPRRIEAGSSFADDVVGGLGRDAGWRPALHW